MAVFVSFVTKGNTQCFAKTRKGKRDVLAMSDFPFFFKKNGIFFKNTIEILFFPLYNIQCNAVVFQHNNQQKKLQLRRMQ